jgi:NADH-quinone oxidoreductase subunit F
MPDEKTQYQQDTGLALDEESSEAQPRVKIEIEAPEDRIKDFREVEKGFTVEEARFEARRCLRCDLEKEKSEL